MLILVLHFLLLIGNPPRYSGGHLPHVSPWPVQHYPGVPR